METLKNEIKRLAAEQPQLKNQRKSVYFVGERTMSVNEARWKHVQNRHNLRHLLLAYATLRGKDLSITDSQLKSEYDLKLVEKFVSLYSTTEEECTNV